MLVAAALPCSFFFCSGMQPEFDRVLARESQAPVVCGVQPPPDPPCCPQCMVRPYPQLHCSTPLPSFGTDVTPAWD